MMAFCNSDSMAKILILILGSLVLSGNSSVWGMDSDQSLSPLFAARTPEERNYLRSLRESLPDYMKEVFEVITSEENTGSFLALRRIGPGDLRHLSFNISVLPREELMDHAELVIPGRRHHHHCMPHIKTSPEHDPVSPIRDASEDGWDVVLDATTSLQRKGMRSEPLLTFDVQLRSRDSFCHLSDLDLSHAYLLTLDAAAYRMLLAHRAALLRSSRREDHRGHVSLPGATQNNDSSVFSSTGGVPSGGEEEQHAETRSIARMRRQVLPPRSLLRMHNPNCHLVTWSLSVEELGLDNVIFPETIQLNRCTGACRPLHFDQVNVMNHTVMKGQYSMKHPSDDVDFSCVPVSFRPISVLYLTMDGSHGYGTFVIQNVHANSCGCR